MGMFGTIKKISIVAAIMMLISCGGGKEEKQITTLSDGKLNALDVRIIMHNSDLSEHCIYTPTVDTVIYMRGKDTVIGFISYHGWIARPSIDSLRTVTLDELRNDRK